MMPTGLQWAAISPDGRQSVVVNLAEEDRDARVVLDVAGDMIWLDAARRDLLIYCEACLVEFGGTVIAARLTVTDFANLRLFKRLGILDFGELPAAGDGAAPSPRTHWVTFTDLAWLIAHALRRERAEHVRAAAEGA